MAPLPAKLKNAAEDAFHDNSLLSLIPPQEREQAAQWYTERAAHFVGTRVELARLYNLERAKFLRGQVVRIAGTAPDFAREISQQAGDKR